MSASSVWDTLHVLGKTKTYIENLSQSISSSGKKKKKKQQRIDVNTMYIVSTVVGKPLELNLVLKLSVV